MALRAELLRQLPQVDDILSHPALLTESERNSRVLVTQAARESIASLRGDILNGVLDALPNRDEIARGIIEKLRGNTTPSLRRVINATGVVLHTNLGRAPLAKSAVEAVEAVAKGYSTLEYDIDGGVRGSRHSHVEKLITKLTGAEDAMVVNNNAAAVLLALSAIASGREVVVSRGELVEIGGAFRIPDVMAQSGCILREVGTTNRTRPADYEAAISDDTGALFKAHTSNFKIMGFTEDVSISELVELGRKHSQPVLHDLGSGSMFSENGLDMLDEPTVADSVKAKTDVVCFSGDKLLGGPQAGIIIGKSEFIARMKKHPLARALRIDKLTLAALEGTLRLYSDTENARGKIPVLRMLGAGRDELREKAARLAALIAELSGQIRVADVDGQAGGGSAPTKSLPSAAVEILPEGVSVTELEKLLRLQELPIVSRIARDRLLLDIRTVEEEDFPYIASCLTAIIGDSKA